MIGHWVPSTVLRAVVVGRVRGATLSDRSFLSRYNSRSRRRRRNDPLGSRCYVRRINTHYVLHTHTPDAARIFLFAVRWVARIIIVIIMVRIHYEQRFRRICTPQQMRMKALLAFASHS